MGPRAAYRTHRPRGLTADALLERASLSAAPAFAGHHSGDHFAVVTAPEALAEVAATLPGVSCLRSSISTRAAPMETCANFASLRSTAVCFRPSRDRVAMESPLLQRCDERSPRSSAEEAAFLENMPAVVGERGVRALEAICATMGLDYAGVDFGLDGTVRSWCSKRTRRWRCIAGSRRVVGSRRRAVDR